MDEPIRREAAAAASWVLLVVIALCMLAPTGGCAASSVPETSSPTTRILFIGNSFTYYNGGIDAQLNHFAPSVSATSVVHGTYWLKDHFFYGTARQAISEGDYAYVVLQDHSQAPVLDPEEFRQYVAAFDQDIRAARGRTVLLETWQTPAGQARGVTTANLDLAYQSEGTNLGVAVAPVGLAFARARQQRPDVVLVQEDGHPTPDGTYLAACVVYGTILKRSPIEIADTGFLISSTFWIAPDTRAFLRRVAAETLGY